MIPRISSIFRLLNEKIEEIVRTADEKMFFETRMKIDILGGMQLCYEEVIKEKTTIEIKGNI